MTRGEGIRGGSAPDGIRGGRARCFGCGKRISPSVSTCPNCAAVQASLCECGATTSAYATKCESCGAGLTPKSYSARRTPLKVVLALLIFGGIAYGGYRLFPRDPYSARLRDFTEAASDFEMGRYEVARVKFARYLEDHPGYSRARYMLGLSLHRSGRREEGVEQVRLALQKNPDLVEAEEFLALTAYDSGWFDEALAVSRRALEKGRPPGLFHLVVGKVLSQPGYLDVTRAAWHLEKALAGGIDDPEGLLILAELTLVLERTYPDEIRRKESAGLLERARDYVAELMRKEPERADLRFFAARCALALGEVSDAWAHLQVCLRLGEEKPPHRLLRARLEWMRGNEAGAKRLLDELVVSDPVAVVFLSVARIYIEEGSLELAAETIDRGRRLFPDDPGLLVAEAHARPERAVELLRRASELRPDAPTITVALANALAGSPDGAGEAEALLRKCLSGQRREPLVQLRLAELLLTARPEVRADWRRRLDEAVELTTSAKGAMLPGDPAGLYLLLVRAQVLIHQRRLEDAAALLSEITSRRPEDPLAHLLLADIHRARDENELAVLELTTVIRLGGEDAPVLRARAEALLGLGPDSVATARKDAVRASDLEPEKEEGLLLLARVEEAAGPTRIDEARGWLRRAAAMPGSTARPLIELGRLEARRGNLDRAEGHIRAAGERARSSEEKLEAVAALAEVESARAGVFFAPGARLLFERAIEEDATDRTSRLRYAALLLDAGDREGARKWAATVNAEDPGDPTALAILVECALADQDVEAARGLIEKLSNADPGGPFAAYARGRLALDEGDYPAAVGELSRARDGAPRNPRTAFFLGVAHFRAGALEPAQVSLERALQLTPDMLSARRLLAEVVRLRGVSLIEAGESERAIPLLQRGLAAAPDHLGLLALLVEAQFAAAKSGDLGLLGLQEDDCLRLIRQLEESAGKMEEEPRVAALLWAYERLESVYLADRDWPALLSTIDSRRSLLPDDADVEMRRGLVLLLAGDADEAVEVLARVVPRRAEDWVVRAMFAESCLRAGRPGDALATVETWLGSHPQDAVARGFLGRIRMLVGDPEGALPDLTAALAGDPDQIEAAEALLDLQIARGRIGDAVEIISGALARTKLRAEFLFLLGRARLGLDFRSAEGLDLLAQARRSGFRIDRLRVLSTLIELRALLDRDRLDAAVALGLQFSEWARGLEEEALEPRVTAWIAETWCLAGVACRRAGANDLAEHRYRKALEALPGFPMAMNNLAEVLAATAESRPAGNLEEAVALARRAVAASPREAGYVDTLALALLRSGAAEEAAKAYERVAELVSEALGSSESGGAREILTVDLARAEAGLATALYATGDRDGAREAFGRAVGRHPGIVGEALYREIAAALE